LPGLGWRLSDHRQAVQRWKKAKRLLPGTVTQDGDDEGIIRLDRQPLPAEAEVIQDLIGIRKRRHMTAEALSKLEHARGSIKSPLLAPPIHYFEEALSAAIPST
jgi:hypothetical protein